VFLLDRAGAGVEAVAVALAAGRPGARVAAGEGDVRERQDWHRCWDLCSERLGPVGGAVGRAATPPQVNILVNIAGVKGEQDWETVYDINLKGVHLGLETAHQRMSLERGGAGGRVLCVSSTAGVTCRGDMFATPAYTASKHAVTALTRTFGVFSTF
jgi:NAD(P)-dependent dehydrogenase (short-subunit alcohol dehydrogenase family)